VRVGFARKMAKPSSSSASEATPTRRGQHGSEKTEGGQTGACEEFDSQQRRSYGSAARSAARAYIVVTRALFREGHPLLQGNPHGGSHPNRPQRSPRCRGMNGSHHADGCESLRTLTRAGLVPRATWKPDKCWSSPLGEGTRIKVIDFDECFPATILRPPTARRRHRLLSPERYLYRRRGAR